VAQWQLELADEARLLYQGKPVPVRKRGLALLALLALGFDGHRERLAAVLWEHGQALNNLRVELHELRRFFPGWAKGADPIALPEGLEVRAVRRPELANLRGITAALDAWIAELGGRSQGEAIPLPELRHPFVLFVRCLPLTDQERVLERVAEAAGLIGTRARRVLGAMRAGHDFDAHTVLRKRDRSWVVFLPPYGEDPAGLLELRASLPAERVRYLELHPLGWWEARGGLLATLPFEEAARVYLAAGGQPGHLGELLALRPPGGFAGRLPLPRRVSAAYRRESRYLSLEARVALERLSVHPGTLPAELITAFGLEEEVEELERKRWLVFRGQGWAFRHEAGRRVLAEGLEEGRRRLYHRRMAEVFDALGLPFAAAYHAEQAGIPGSRPQGARGWARGSKASRSSRAASRCGETASPSSGPRRTTPPRRFCSRPPSSPPCSAFGDVLGWRTLFAWASTATPIRWPSSSLELAFYRLAGSSGARVSAFALDLAHKPGLLGRRAP